MENFSYLRDSAFLKELDKIKNKEQFVKITVLNFFEKPIKSIEGKVTSGVLNIDGNSSIRRTCNISLVTDAFENDLTDIDNLFSINKKVNIKIGFSNETKYYQEFPILWFPIGIYVIQNPALSHGLDGVSISLQLCDKMCLLNGESGGIIPASTTFHEYETVNEDGEYVILRPTIYQIIKELVNHFGGEQLSKIIISDLDTRVKQVMKWSGSSPLYITSRAVNGTIQYTPTMDAELAAQSKYNMYENGMDVGYIYTDFTYPGELIGDAGSTVTDILDKIIEVLGNYEYFYDVDGNFHFQEIKNYLNTSKSTVELNNLKNEDYVIDQSKGKSVYVFDGGTLITSYSNTPQYHMIKNDFIVWGMKENELGNKFPIRYHLAIDEKPKVGNEYQVFFYTDEDKNVKAKCPLHFRRKSDFPIVGSQEVFYMDDSSEKIYEWDSKTKTYKEITVGLETIKTKDWRTELYLQGTVAEPLGSDSNYYYTELKNEWTKIYDLKKGAFKPETLKFPSDIDFFLDFIDKNAQVSELSIQNIGRRTQVVVDDSINCVFEPEIPNLVLLNTDDENIAQLRQECELKGQDYIQMDKSMFQMVVGGGSFNSAYVKVRELLYQYTSYNNTVVINALPVLYLEPNTRITIRDKQSGIYGDYMINNISIPFDVNSTMTISCVKALERI